MLHYSHVPFPDQEVVKRAVHVFFRVEEFDQVVAPFTWKFALWSFKFNLKVTFSLRIRSEKDNNNIVQAKYGVFYKFSYQPNIIIYNLCAQFCMIYSSDWVRKQFDHWIWNEVRFKTRCVLPFITNFIILDW